MNKAIFNGILATLMLVAIYFAIVPLVSGFSFAMSQFSRFWYFVIALAIGFGIQVGLYSYLKSIVKKVSPGVVATTGTTSTAAMISCCAHYLGNILPILGAVGVITVISQYQMQLFWVGLAFNFLGLVYMLIQVRKHTKMLSTGFKTVDISSTRLLKTRLKAKF